MVTANSLAIFLYLGCSAMLMHRFIKLDQKPITISISAHILTIFALLLHGTGIFFTMQQAGGWNLSLPSTIVIVSWLMAFITSLLGTQSYTAHPGIIIYPLVALCLIVPIQIPQDTANPIPNSALEWHILLSLAAYSLFSLAAVQAVVLAIQDQKLHQRQTNILVRKLPPLQLMEATLFRLLTLGFFLLTTGLITGSIFINDLFHQHLSHKILLSIVSWCIFATLLWGRWRYGWRGKLATKWTLLGFTFLVLAFIGSKLIMESLLNQN